MPFTMEDFKKKENIEKLQVIILAKLGKNPLSCFRNLTTGEQKRFNREMNVYLSFLPDEWEEQLQKDFNETCNDDIFNNKFKAESNLFGCDINTDIIELRE